MPRFKRVVIPGMPHHVVQRGNHRMNIFLDDSDRLVFLRMLLEASEEHGLINLGYSLMTNHEHQISIPQEESSLALAMHDLLGPYASYFNRKYGLSGRLWQGRFYSTPLDDQHLWTALRYVELNPERAGLVSYAEQYAWSSARSHCGLLQDPLLAPLPPGAVPTESWSEWLRAGNSASELKFIRSCTKTGRPCGAESFIKNLEQITGRILTPRKVGRPSIQKTAGDILDSVCKGTQQEIFAAKAKSRK
jgi:putative transposase